MDFDKFLESLTDFELERLKKSLNKKDGIKVKKESKKHDLKKRYNDFQDEVVLYIAPTLLKNSFIDYWTELNKSKTKMKFELQQTFEIKKRLNTWIKNNYNYKKQRQSKTEKLQNL